MLVTPIIVHEPVQLTRPTLCGNAAQECKHNRLININERKFTADVGIHQHIELLVEQQKCNRIVDVRTENALTHPFAEEPENAFRISLPLAHETSIGFGIPFYLIEELLIDGMETFYAEKKHAQQHLQHVARTGLHIAQIGFFLLMAPFDTLFQQRLLIGKKLVKRALRHAHTVGYVVHGDATYAICRKRLHGYGHDTALLFGPQNSVFYPFICHIG